MLMLMIYDFYKILIVKGESPFSTNFGTFSVWEDE